MLITYTTKLRFLILLYITRIFVEFKTKTPQLEELASYMYFKSY